MDINSVKKNTILNALRMVLTVLVPLITFPYISRVFLTEGNGQLNFALSVTQIFTLFASLGIYTYGVREGSSIRSDRKKFSKLAHELLIINFGSTIFTYVVFFCLVAFYQPFRHYRLLLMIDSLIIGFTALGLDWVYGVYEEYKYITLRQIAVQLFVLISMFCFIKEPKDIYLWALLTVTSTVGANIFNIFYSKRYIDFSQFYWKHLKLRKHIKPILILFATQLAGQVYSHIAIILLGILAYDHNTGLYAAAVKVNVIMITFFIAMNPVFMPTIVELMNTSQLERYFAFFENIIKTLLVFVVPTVLGLELLADEIILLLAGKAFINAAVTMRILAPVIMLTTMASLFYYNYFVPRHLENTVLKCTSCAAIINFIASLLLIPYFAENGAAIGSLVAESVALLVALRIAYKVDTRIRLCMPSVTNIVVGCILISVWCLVCKYIIVSLISRIIIVILGSTFIYVSYFILVKDPISDDIFKVINKLKSKIRCLRGV